MKKRFLFVLLILGILFPAYGEAPVPRRVKRAAAQRAASDSRANHEDTSTTMIWTGNDSGPYYFDLSSPDNKEHLKRMINIPTQEKEFPASEYQWFTPKVKKTITKPVDENRKSDNGNGTFTWLDVKDKEDLADDMIDAGKVPEEWSQVGYIAGLDEYLKKHPNVLDQEQKDYIRFIELYIVAPIYMSKYKGTDNFDRVEKIRQSIHGFVGPTSGGITVLGTKTTDGGATKQHYIRDRVAEKQGEKPKDGQGGGGGGQGGGPGGGPGGVPGGGPGGVPGGVPGGDPNGSVHGSPNGVPGGKLRGEPIFPWSFPYNDHVYEPAENGEDTPIEFAA